MRIKILSLLVLTTLLMVVCQSNIRDSGIDLNASRDAEMTNSKFRMVTMDKFSLDLLQLKTVKNEEPSLLIEDFMNLVNSEFLLQGISLQLGMIESHSLDGKRNTVFFNNRDNKQMETDFVSGDLRRSNSNSDATNTTDIFYAIDGQEAKTSCGLSKTETDGAIIDAMSTWNQVNASKKHNISNIGSSTDTPLNFNLGYVEFLISGGASGSPLVTDVMHSGFNDLIDTIYGPGNGVPAVTFTFWFVDEHGNPTDIDHNGKNDTAFRDIYYNDSLQWKTDENQHSHTILDVETVDLHQLANALHGYIAKDNRSELNNKLQSPPSAFINESYSGNQRTIDGTYKGVHLSICANWPNN